jgi:hypothetical protein
MGLKKTGRGGEKRWKEGSNTNNISKGTKEALRVAVAMNVYRFVYLISFSSTQQ